MFAFYNVRRNVSNKVKLQERLSRIPAILLDGLFSKFTDSARGSTKYVVLLVVNAHSHQGVTSQNACYSGTRDKPVDTHVRSVPPCGRMGDRYNDPSRRSQHACCKSEPAVQITWFVGSKLSMFCRNNPSRPTLGCKIEKLTKKELDRRRLPEGEANTKRAHLTVPLEFPKARMKRRK